MISSSLGHHSGYSGYRALTRTASLPRTVHGALDCSNGRKLF
jgi:hypothetical protein